MSTPRELAAQNFKKGDRVRDRAGRTGVVDGVNVYVAAVITVRYDDNVMNVSPVLFYDLINLTNHI
jgi:hypothetical protein